MDRGGTCGLLERSPDEGTDGRTNRQTKPVMRTISSTTLSRIVCGRWRRNWAQKTPRWGRLASTWLGSESQQHSAPTATSAKCVHTCRPIVQYHHWQT